jgi:thiosulfate dehydrogenase (quinone) large subunit
MTTTSRDHVAETTDKGSPQLVHAAATELRRPHWSVDLLRFGLGFVFLWAFLDKAFGLGYSTPGSKSWVFHGGSPTNGFLSHAEVGPLQSSFRSIAGAGWADWLFMLGLLGLGVALIAGVTLRIAAVTGSILLLLMWAAEWPMAQHSSTGDATGSTNPFVDYHLIFALGLIVVAAVGVGSTWGFGQRWSQRRIVQRHSILL